MKIRLIDPALKVRNQQQHTKKEIKSFWFPHLSLTMLAGLTPKEHDVQITDENVDEINFEEEVDLVGITGMTIHAYRAYEIAEKFRSRGVPVVMGGIHASNLPQEAKNHVDSVVIGEAETLWENVLEDTRNRTLKPFYEAKNLCSLANMPHPRQDLLKRNAYLTTNCVQTTRGCPFDCSFCSVTQFFGHRYRFRPVEQVVEEVKKYSGEFVAFVDDNIAGSPAYAKELFNALKPLHIKWGSQASLTMARDNELLALAAESGCIAMFVGIESLSQTNLAKFNKSFNKVNEYSEAIRKFHDHGIMINGSFMFGLEYDDESVFEKTARFIEDNKIELVTYNILTPLPGTRFYQQMERENRITDRDWSKYNSGNVVFKPKLMLAETLQNGYHWAAKKTYSYRSILKRVCFTGSHFFSRFLLNVGYRGLAQQVPKGKISHLAKLLRKLNDSISIKETKTLVPTLKDNYSKDTLSSIISGAEKHLNINTIKNELAQTFIITLEGSLDIRAAKKLTKRLKRLINKGQEKIILDFGGITYFSPKAINLLILSNYDFLNRLKGRIKFVRLNEQISGMMENLMNFIFDWEILEDEALLLGD